MATIPASDYERAFAERFRRQAESALDELQDDVETGSLDRAEAARMLFSRYLECPAQLQDCLASALLTLMGPEEILDLALHEYEQFGWARRLETAAILLERAGVASWPALQALLQANRPECETFVRTIAFLDGVPLRDRLQALKRLAANPDKETREQVLEVLRYFEPADVREILELLAQDNDAEIRQVAIEELA